MKNQFTICPSCESSFIPNNLTPGAYPGALSRVDNKTEICSECGELEALYDYAGTPEKMPLHNRPNI